MAAHPFILEFFPVINQLENRWIWGAFITDCNQSEISSESNMDNIVEKKTIIEPQHVIFNNVAFQQI